MKITQIAVFGILVLVGVVAYLLNSTAQDEKLAKLQQAINELNQQQRARIDANAAESALAPAPAVPAPTVPAQAAPVAVSASVQPTAVPVVVPAQIPVAPTAPTAGLVPPTTPTPVTPTPGLTPADLAQQGAATTPVAGATASPVASVDPNTIPIPGAIPALPPDAQQVAARELEMMKANAETLRKTLKDVPTPDDLLSPLALRIRKLSPLCKISEVHEAHGFVILNAGSKVGLAKGGHFSVRRDHMIVAKITISDVQNDATAVADILPKSVPLGVTIKPGDEIVKLDE